MAGACAGDLYVRLVVSLPEQPDESLRDFLIGWPGNYDPAGKKCGKLLLFNGFFCTENPFRELAYSG